MGVDELCISFVLHKQRTSLSKELYATAYKSVIFLYQWDPSTLKEMCYNCKYTRSYVIVYEISQGWCLWVFRQYACAT